MNKRKQLLILLKKEAFLKKRVTLSSGRISNFYIDVRKVSLSPKGVYLISHLIFTLLKAQKISAIGGPTLGADPIVGGICCLAYKNKKKLKGFLIRKSPKKHGRQKLIEGPALNPGERVVIIDDVATSGFSLIKSIEVLKKEKHHPKYEFTCESLMVLENLDNRPGWEKLKTFPLGGKN